MVNRLIIEPSTTDYDIDDLDKYVLASKSTAEIEITAFGESENDDIEASMRITLKNNEGFVSYYIRGRDDIDALRSYCEMALKQNAEVVARYEQEQRDDALKIKVEPR